MIRSINRRLARKQRGQMSIEYIVIIALVAIVLAGMVYFFTVGRVATKVDNTVKGVSYALTKAQALYMNDPQMFTNVSATSLINNGGVPDSLNGGTVINSPFGGTIDVAPAAVYGGAAGSGIQFVIPQVPSTGCSDLVNGLSSAFVNVTVGTTVIRSNGTNVANYADTLGTACKAGSGNTSLTLVAGR